MSEVLLKKFGSTFVSYLLYLTGEVPKLVMPYIRKFRFWFPTGEFQSCGFSHSWFYVRFCILTPCFKFPGLIVSPPLFYTHLSAPHEVCDSSDKGAHYYILNLKLHLWRGTEWGIVVQKMIWELWVLQGRQCELVLDSPHTQVSWFLGLYVAVLTSFIHSS